jgi:hypothetical protein
MIKIAERVDMSGPHFTGKMRANYLRLVRAA